MHIEKSNMTEVLQLNFNHDDLHWSNPNFNIFGQKLNISR